MVSILKTKNIKEARMCFQRLLKDVTDKHLEKSLRTKFKAAKDYEAIFAVLTETIRSSARIRFLARIKDPFAKAQMEKMLNYNHQILEIMDSASGGNQNQISNGTNKRKNRNKTGKYAYAEGVLALDKRYFLIYGKCQSGKTRFMQDIVFSHILINKCSGIVILRNCVGDSEQLQKRCNEYQIDCEKWMQLNHPNLKGEGLNFVYPNNASKSEQLQDALSGKKPSLIVVIANSTQMLRVKKAITETQKPRYIVAIDEADQVAYGEQSASFRSILQEDILPNAGRVYGVTATSFDMVFTEEKIDTAAIIVLERKDMYKGLRQIELRELRDQATPANKTHDWFDNDGNILPVLSHLGEIDCRKYSYSQPDICKLHHNIEHPTITIIKNTHLNSSQDKLLQHIVSSPQLQMWSVLIYNGQGISVYHPRTSLLQKMRGKSPSSRKWATDNPVENTLFFRGLSVSDGLEYLRQLDMILQAENQPRVTHIAVIAGDLADRGISFVSSGYHWHPTSMYYVPSAGATVSHIIQAAGRLCGNFDDDIPLQLFAPSETLENLKRGINLQEDCLERAKINAKGCAVTVIQGMAISTDKIPTRPMGHQVENEEVAIRANAIEGQDEGVDLAVFKENEIKPMLPGDTTDEETKGDEDVPHNDSELPRQEFERLTQKMFPRWAKSDSKIARFMNNLDPTKKYSSDEFRVLCKENKISDIFQLCDINRCEGSRGFGTIIQRVGHTFQLYPELIKCFKRYF
jgi:hypothetical protein